MCHTVPGACANAGPVPPSNGKPSAGIAPNKDRRENCIMGVLPPVAFAGDLYLAGSMILTASGGKTDVSGSCRAH